MFQVTAALTEAGVLELTGENLPEEKDGLTVQFVSPAASTEGLQMQFAGEDTQYPILTTGEDKAPIQAGAFGEGVPVTLTISGGKAFFKLGGAGINDNLPAQVTAFKAIDSSGGGTAKVTISWTNPSEYFAGILIVKKAGSAPTGVGDGEKVYNGTGTSFVDSAVEFDTEYYYRAYPYNEKKQYQTLKNVVSVAPKAGILLLELPLNSRVNVSPGSDIPSDIWGDDNTFLVVKDSFAEDSRNLIRSKNLIMNQGNYSAIESYITNTVKNILKNKYKNIISTYLPNRYMIEQLSGSKMRFAPTGGAGREYWLSDPIGSNKHLTVNPMGNIYESGEYDSNTSLGGLVAIWCGRSSVVVRKPDGTYDLI